MDAFKEFEGKSLDDAIREACNYYNTSREKLEIDIIQDFKSGIFGIVGARKAKIKARRAQLKATMENLLGRAKSSPGDAPVAEPAEVIANEPLTEEKREDAPRRKEGESQDRHARQQDGARGSKPAHDKSRPKQAKGEGRPKQAREDDSRGNEDNGSKNRPGGNRRTNEGEAPRPRDRDSRDKDKERDTERHRQKDGESHKSRDGEQHKPRNEEAHKPRDGEQHKFRGEDKPKDDSRRPRSKREPGRESGRDSWQGARDQASAPTINDFIDEIEHEGLPTMRLDEVDAVKLCELCVDTVDRLVTPIIGKTSLSAEIVDGRVNVSINCGEDSGLLIGREGQTLASLQFLASRIVSQSMGFIVRVQLDAGEYRLRQYEKLRELALALAEKVRGAGKSVSTRPMSSYHRRIIHMTLQDNPDVQTRSTGEGPLKRVVVQRKKSG